MADKALCCVTGCINPARTRGCCQMHYYRLLKHGDPLAGQSFQAKRGEPLGWIDRHKNHQGDECLIWPFARYPNGYGHVTRDGRATMAARVMCIIAHGEPPADKPFALHSCANGHGGCVSPRHVRWGTQAENMADSVADGTRCRGERHHASKLTEADVHMIRSSGESARSIANCLGLHEETVCRIRRRQSWAWIK